ncbi:MAG: DUF721 domain-containing protein [Nitrosomonas sp.]|uniref:DUF721 domain-containing protein n=1 Tax=Nitrosomonas sp. TaxID=42353 RepID=UPI0027367A35|nr:DUF721 domain-containing protein [Nitrosomonas sp.]MDP3279713.1 DUF721 domain-containing protein [Nitrosomonas sp.]MDP3663197.1 DUF721 domain-containing protein [Nitrosomonas sp.]MDZ4104815.1 DUF721 domain-containing protein [Nitrosomonas sp.]
MTSYKVNSYLNLLGKTPEYENLFSLAHQLYADQLIFSKLVPAQLAQHCVLSRTSNGKLTIMAENGAIASKLKQISPSVLLKLQELGWEVTSIQILVQAPNFAKNTKTLADKGYTKKKLKLSQTGKDCLSRLATTLPDSELKNTIQSFVKKHKND